MLVHQILPAELRSHTMVRPRMTAHSNIKPSVCNSFIGEISSAYGLISEPQRLNCEAVHPKHFFLRMVCDKQRTGTCRYSFVVFAPFHPAQPPQDPFAPVIV